MSLQETVADTMTYESNDLHDNFPRTSGESNELKQETTSTTHITPSVTPSTRLLFSFVPRTHLLFLVIPGVFVSILAGAIAPFMTQVVGQAFDAFARFAASQQPPQVARDILLHNVGIAALTLVGLALGSFALSSLTSCLWIWIGETNVLALRRAVYIALTQKDLAWFDTQLGSSDDETSVGAAGLMAKLSSETDDIRMASSLACGTLIQYLTTTCTCLILAFLRSWQLTLVILSALPLLVFLQGLSQNFASPLLQHERQQTATAANIVERAATSIATVKAFNAVNFEISRAIDAFERLRKAAGKLNALWACTSGISQFVIMSMFVQGFWFGSKLVREGRITPGDVMAVFWACLIASSNLQMCIPQFIVLAKGKFAMVSLVSLISPSPSDPSSSGTVLKMKPLKCHGSFALHNVSFAYPSRPDTLVLDDVSLFLPANEMTFIVGSSGSGKSTIAHLLQKLYEPSEGMVTLDEHDTRYLDDGWVRSHVGCVSQAGGAGDGGVVILDGRSIYHNIAAAVYGQHHTNGGQKPTKREIEEVCRMALLHDFVRDLPEGYETFLGGTDGNGKGVGLSGGQKQRLAIARARLKDPTVLILDEPTSALDATSRLLIFEAVRHWRQNRTTIVITHDLSQISPQDFVYVMKDGRVVEQGFRSNLEEDGISVYGSRRGEFGKMLESQAQPVTAKSPKKSKASRVFSQNSFLGRFKSLSTMHHQASNASMRRATTALRHLTFGNWMLDVVADLTQTNGLRPTSPMESFTLQRQTISYTGTSTYITPPIHNEVVSNDIFTPVPERRRPSTTSVDDLLSPPSPVQTVHAKRFSLPQLHGQGEKSKHQAKEERTIMEKSVDATRKARDGRIRKDTNAHVGFTSIDVETAASPNKSSDEHASDIPRLWTLIRSVFPLIPHKPLLVIGLVVCLISGAMTPIFSFFLSRLLFEVSAGAQNSSTINTVGGIVLGIAAVDGLFLGFKYIIMETCGLAFTNTLRTISLRRILLQDKSWFDRSSNAPSQLVQILIKDGEDARDLVAVVFGQCFVVIAMLGVGLVWAFVRGWQLTLAGLAIAPVFAVLMAVQSRLAARCEVGNKRARERVSRGYYDAIINIRGIKSMSLDGVFKAQFDSSAEKALHAGVRGAFVEGCTYGLASGLIYLAEALLFYVGALLIANGVYSYLQMIEVLNLVVFSVTIGSQLMAFTEKIAKASQATQDLKQLTTLDTDTCETRGALRPEISGSVRFKDVAFAYPGQDGVSALRNLNLEIRSGECVAIVGASGCGKSTILSLLQRLYEPSAGSISIGQIDTRLMSTTHLRDHMSVVSQQPHLFDATIAENIRYGRPSVTDIDVEFAAKAAQLHEFILSLPQGYQTHLGENASLISGGQAQRLQIARALARPSRILVLDECTSALDLKNQAAILDAIRWAKYGRTVVMVSHKLEAMRMCDRIVLVQEGRVAEQGTFDELMDQKGAFATLASGGEWMSD